MSRYLWILLLFPLPALLGCPISSSDTVEHGNVSFDVSSDGAAVVFSDATGDLWLLALSSNELTRLTESKELESWPSFSPDGKSVVFVKESEKGHGMSVFVIAIHGKEIRRLTSSDNCSDSQPVFSPDGKTIAFSRSHLRRRYSMGGWKWDKWDVYTIFSDGTRLKRQTHGEHNDIGGVAFTGDSKNVYFSADEFPNADSKETLFTVTLEDASIVATKPGQAGGYYAWCTDPNTNVKEEMVFISDRNSPYQYDVVFVSQEGRPITLGMTTVSRYNKNPVIIKDGRIFFLAGTAWNASSRPIFSLWSVKSDGTGAKQLAGSDLFTNPLEWKPPTEGNRTKR